MTNIKSIAQSIVFITAAGIIGIVAFLLVQNPAQSPAKHSYISDRDLDDLIIVRTPLDFQEISSPVIIEGRARGIWFFEADFPITLVDETGKILGIAIAKAQSDWMTEDFVNFKAELAFESAADGRGTLILSNNNPSDLAENNRQMKIPVTITTNTTDKDPITVKVFFNNSKFDPDFLEIRSYPVERQIPYTKTVARAAIEELLKGPSELEKSLGYFTNINPGVKIQKLTIYNGLARADFSEQLEYQVAGSARVGAIRDQIIQTLKQFTSVNEVAISINGRTEDILQP